VRLLAALVLPPLLTLGIALAAVRIVGGLPASPHKHAHAVVWGTRTFTSRAAFGRWLESRGRSYEAWARRHPAKAAAAAPKAEQSTGRRPLLLGGIAVLALGGLALLRRGRRGRPPLARRRSLPRPRVGATYARAQSATHLVWRAHPDVAWYVAGGALAVGAGLVVAGWN
jgi:hypothetical protein